MSSETEGLDTADRVPTRVYTTADGRTVIEQPDDAVVTLTADQILTVIAELRVCYDYCATWKDSPREATKDGDTGAQP